MMYINWLLGKRLYILLMEVLIMKGIFWDKVAYNTKMKPDVKL